MLCPGSTGSFLSVWFGWAAADVCPCSAGSFLSVFVFWFWFGGFGVRFWEPKRSSSGYGGFWCAKCSLSGLRRRSSVFYDSLNLGVRHQGFNVSLLQDVRVSSFDECCEYGGSSFRELELLLRLQVTWWLSPVLAFGTEVSQSVTNSRGLGSGVQGSYLRI